MNLKDIPYGGLDNMGAKAHLLNDKLPLSLCYLPKDYILIKKKRVLIYETQRRQYEGQHTPLG